MRVEPLVGFQAGSPLEGSGGRGSAVDGFVVFKRRGSECLGN
jgi:hypothetical protein